MRFTLLCCRANSSLRTCSAFVSGCLRARGTDEGVASLRRHNGPAVDPLLGLSLFVCFMIGQSDGYRHYLERHAFGEENQRPQVRVPILAEMALPMAEHDGISACHKAPAGEKMKVEQFGFSALDASVDDEIDREAMGPPRYPVRKMTTNEPRTADCQFESQPAVDAKGTSVLLVLHIMATGP